jgi:uncharacterized iron-regulated membrane protein
MKLRTLIFWPHLVAGVIAGVVILIMSLTGVLLMYERQMIAWAERHDVTPPSPAAPRLGVEELLARVHQAQPEAEVTAVTLRAGERETALVSLGQRTVQVDPYTGHIFPEGSSGMRAFMSSLRSWHRWLAMSNENRATARFITGWSNFLFAFIVLSGMYLWLPRVWTWTSVRAVLLFRGGLRAKARDFNWHNVIGIWSCVPLFLVVITAFPISFPWAGNLLYRMVGEEPPAQGRPGPGGPGGPPAGARPAGAGERAQGGEARRENTPFETLIAGLDPVFTRAAQQVEGWRSINLRVPPSADAPLAFTIDQGDGGQPQLRSTLTLNRAGEVVRWEPFESQSLGRRLRSWSRFTHTGEAFGLAGQTIAGIVSAGGCVLVYTGLALSLRRFLAWRRRLAAQRAAARVDSFEGVAS